jgi:ferritin-like metal-binding protein YciE
MQIAPTIFGSKFLARANSFACGSSESLVGGGMPRALGSLRSANTASHLYSHQPYTLMPKTNSLNELLIEELKDLYSAETQLTKALPKMSKAASNDELRAAFDEHLEQTKVHVSRLERAMELLGADPKGKTCKAMEGLIEEASEKIEMDAEPSVRDAALIGAAQKVEHYEIAGYGTARTFAETLGEDDVADILQETLDEEAEADDRLTDLADTVNEEAEQPNG